MRRLGGYKYPSDKENERKQKIETGTRGTTVGTEMRKEAVVLVGWSTWTRSRSTRGDIGEEEEKKEPLKELTK